MGRYCTHKGVWPLRDVRGKLVVVYPDPGGIPDGDAVVVFDETDLQVLDDDVGRVEHVKSLVGDFGCAANAND